MTKKIRLIILALAIFCFLIVTPLALLYGWGYRYDLKDKAFIQTGAIYLNSLPRKAKILLDGVEKKKKTPLVIDGLLSEKYSIKVEFQGFHPWQKTLEVKPTLVTEVKNILLIPENPKIIPLENKEEIEASDPLLSPDKGKLAFSFKTKQGNAGIWILDLNDEDKIALIDNKVLNLEQSYNDFTALEWSADSNKLFFSSQDHTNKKTFFIIDLPRTEVLVRGLENFSETVLEPPEKKDLPTTPPSTLPTSSQQTSWKANKLVEDFKKTGVLNLTSSIGTPLKIRWHGRNPNVLLWLAPHRDEVSGAALAETEQENILFQLDLSGESLAVESDKNKLNQIIAKGVLDFSIDRNDIYIIKKISAESSTSSSKYTIYKNNFELVKFPEELGEPREIFVLEDRGLTIKTDEDKIYLLILQGNSPLLNDNPSPFLLAKGIKFVEPSPDKNKILYWFTPYRDEVSGAGQDSELKIYFLQKNISYEKGVGDIETINFDFPIEQVLWYKDSEHLIYAQNGTIRITEIDPRGERNDVKFVEGENPIYDPTKDILYFLNKGNLYQVEFPTKTFF